MGRLEKEIVLNTGAYTRYEYPTNGIQSKVYSTITDVNSNNTADVADEVLSESWTDGAGRVRRSRSEHPGSAGGWSATLTEYDVMGRTWRSTVPTEVNSGWSPAGDDAARGWIWNTQEFDWKGRVTHQINTDGTDKLFSYTGCGCAGGQITTIQSELVPRDDQPTVMARRTQKIYEDILGRTFKSETLNWNGTVYSTNKSFFNGRDQVTLSRQFAGAESSSTFQDTVMTFDGYGRLKTQKRPEQNTGTATTYNYFPDDRIQQTIDARGATINYQYNNRGLVTQVSTTSPNPSVIPVTPTVTMSYDNLGNRTQMTDGLGSMTYEYDQLSQLTAETRQFSDSMPNAPLSNNRFKLEYGYSLSGQLKSYKDAYGQQINYAQDKIGRLNQVTGSTAFGGVTSYANNPTFRAWGALKSLSYGSSNAQLNVTYNNRLQTSNYLLTTNGTNQIKKDYQYLASGDLSFIDDTLNTSSGFPPVSTNRFDRSFKFDHLGRTTQTRTGAEAVGGTDTPDKIPYHEDFYYDAFGHRTMIDGTIWDTVINEAISVPTYINNRGTNRNYDAEGNEIGGGAQSYQFEANGRLIFSQGALVENTQYADGDGAELKRIRRTRADEESNWSTPTVSYFIRSSVLGIVNEVKSNGAKDRAYVYGAGTVIARQVYANSTEQVDWEHYDASGMTLKYTGAGVSTSAELNGLGNNVGLSQPTSTPIKNTSSPFDTPMAQTLQQSGGCVIDGIEGDCSMVTNETARQCPNNDCSPRRNKNNNGWIVWGVTEIRDKKQKPTLKTAPKRSKAEYARLRALGNLTPSEGGQLNRNHEFLWRVTYMPNLKNDTGLLPRLVEIFSDPKITSEECKKAFQALGAVPIGDQLAAQNVHFVTESVFMNSAHDDHWAPDKEFAKRLRDVAADHTGRLTGQIEVEDITWPAEYKGKRYIGITNLGIDDDRMDFLSVTVIHALIHSGGVPGTPQPPSHDLVSKGSLYDNAIEACQRKTPRMPKAGGREK